MCFLICPGNDIHSLLVCVLVACCAISVVEVLSYMCLSEVKLPNPLHFLLLPGLVSQTATIEFKTVKDDQLSGRKSKS